MKAKWWLATAATLTVGSVAAIGAWEQWFDDPDMPFKATDMQKLSKEEFMLGRAQFIGDMRGLSDSKFKPELRQEALELLAQEDQNRGTSTGFWLPLGPAPIPNGQVVGPTPTPVSGRTISIAVNPTNPEFVFVGTANGGLYRSLNGGANWTPLLDNADSMAIGAIAISPSQPSTIYVGTGEPNFSVDSFFGVGIYRIDNAYSGSPIVTGPLNKNAANADVFTGRAISQIKVHPTDPNIIFVGTTSGLGGFGVAQSNLPLRGVYRSTNAASASPTFEKLTALANNDSSVRDIAIDPSDPNLLVAGVVAAGGVGGIYVSTDALAASPTFTQRQTFTSTSTNELTSEFAVHGTGAGLTIYAGTGNLGGRVLRSTDRGTTWVERIDNNFCTPQCFYDIAIAVAPDSADRVYIGGSPTVPFGFSNDGGTTFTTSAQGLHVDSHVIAVAPSNGSVVYFGSDGGIYRSNDAGSNWINLNAGFSATQFQSLATHPTDRNFLIGGTQDNGTNFYRPDGTWTRADFGDGGFTEIDQNAADTTNVRMYHTYFNQTNAMGYARVTNVASATDGNWQFFGCGFAGSTANGMTCAATAILFYAPTATGPGNPNTFYFGSDVLYRSTDGGTTVTKVSQEPIVSAQAITAIGIAPGNDNVRAVGLRNGALFRVTDGSSTMVSVDPVGAGSVIPDVYIGRIVINPTDANIAFVALSGYPGAGQNIWKTSNFLAATPTWTAASSGIPNVAVTAMAIDPANVSQVWAGTDIGVYRSLDNGLTWSAASRRLPRVPVFGMTFQAPRAAAGRGPLRIATHGRGIWEFVPPNPDVNFRDGFEDNVR